MIADKFVHKFAKTDVDLQFLNVDLKEEFKKNGFFEIKNEFINKQIYRNIYKDFDTLIRKARNNERFKKDLKTLEQAFRGTPFNYIFCQAPAGYRDCAAEVKKADNKQYFQFNPEYYQVIKESHSDILKRNINLKFFFDKLLYIDIISKNMFEGAIKSLKKLHPRLEKIMYGNRRNLSVIIKVLSYNASINELSTSPHYDKSGLTIILDNNDKINDRLVLSGYQKKFDFSRLRAPIRKFDSGKDYTSGILIPGALLQKQGINIKPTPHAVLPAPYQRYSIIAFALVPNMNVRNINSMIENKSNIVLTQK